jgi:Site-specific recombinase XerD
MERTRITKSLIDAIEPGQTDVWIWDRELPGFGIRVQPSGRKTYVVRYRTRRGMTHQRKMTIARCCDLTPDKAREQARKVFAAVADGRDPVGDMRQAAADAKTMQDLKVHYMRLHAKPFKKPRSIELDEKNWRLHVLPAIGNKQVREVTKTDILSIHGSLSSHPATANQVLAMLSKAFNLAEDWEWRERNTNPTDGVKKFSIPIRETILSTAQLQRLHLALAAMVEDRSVPKEFGDLVRLLILTGCRLREIMHAKREWVDDERRVLVLPNTKVGRRIIALSQPCMDIIRGIPRSNEWLIPGRVANKPMITPYSMWRRLKKRAGLPDELRIHDLRHTAGSMAHAAGLTQKQVAIMLGHRQLSTTERYIHGLHGEGARVMDTLASVITQSWSPAQAT